MLETTMKLDRLFDDMDELEDLEMKIERIKTRIEVSKSILGFNNNSFKEVSSRKYKMNFIRDI